MTESARVPIPEGHEPQFVFICGPVGCGNSFLFRCLTEDTGNYGIDEGNIGGTLRRLTESERNIVRCPHAREAFVEFMHSLAADRHTFIEKSPSNIRHQSFLRETLDTVHFIFTVREPHAAIVSGLSGRTLVKDTEHVARLWRSDCELITNASPGDIIVIYDDFVRDPTPTLNRISENVLPLSDNVYRFANRMTRPDRADTSRWRSRIDHATAEEIEYWVRELGLDTMFASFRGGGQPSTPALSHPTPASLIFQRARAQFFNLYYRRHSKNRLSPRGGA